MIVRLFHADKTVRDELREAIQARDGFVLATQIQGPRNASIENRTPFKEILESGGNSLDLLVLIDEGRPEGMWRDPFGELCDRLFTERREAATATTGYVLIRAGQAMAYFRKALWDPLEDAEEITAYLGRVAPVLFKAWTRPKPKAVDPFPTRAPRPKPKKTPIVNFVAGVPAFSSEAKATVEVPSVILSPEMLSEPAPADESPTLNSRRGEDDGESASIDPWTVLGIHKGTQYEQVRRAYRALVQQYHPDKVAHLAPEFRKLAEERTRDLNLAFTLIEKTLGKKDGG